MTDSDLERLAISIAHQIREKSIGAPPKDVASAYEQARGSDTDNAAVCNFVDPQADPSIGKYSDLLSEDLISAVAVRVHSMLYAARSPIDRGDDLPLMEIEI